MNQIVQQIPAHLQGNRRQVSAAAVSGMGTLPQPYISIEGGAFTLVDAQGMQMPWQRLGLLPHMTQQGVQMQGLSLDAVAVDVNENMSKAYYVDAWSPNAQKYLPPICWSDNGLAPSVSATQPQNGTCETCPWNKWGSKVNNLGNEVKACDDMKKIAWYIPELQMQLVFLMRLKGSSHKNWRAYIDKVRKNSVGDRPADLVDVVTRIYFEPGSTGILNFDMVGFIDAATANAQDQIWAAKTTDLLIGRLDVPRPISLPAPTPANVHAQPQAALPPPPQTAPAPTTFRAQPPQTHQSQPNPQPQQQNASAAAPTGFGAQTAPLPPQGGQPASPAGFGGHAANPNPAPTAATASPSDQLPPSGRPPRKQRAPRPQVQPQTQAVTHAPQQQGFGGQPQQHQQPTAPQPQPPNHQPQAPHTAPAPQNFGITAGAPLNADLDDALNNAIGS